MTSRQRLWSAFHCEPVDRIPVSPQDHGAVDLNTELGQRLLHETDIHLYTGSYFDWFGAGVENQVSKMFKWGISAEYFYGGTLDTNLQTEAPVALGSRGDVVGSYDNIGTLFCSVYFNWTF